MPNQSANLLLTAIFAFFATLLVIPSHEVMHGFGGALFGHGAIINLNGANPRGLEFAEQWVIFALSGTVYLFYMTTLLFLAFCKWRRPYLLGMSLASGTVHQVGFFADLLGVVRKGYLEGNGSDLFHAAAILWNKGPLTGGVLPWREIVFASGWPSFLIVTVLVATFALWACFTWQIAAMATSRKTQTRLMFVISSVVSFFVIFVCSAIVSRTYAVLAKAIDESWSASPTIIWVVGVFLIITPVLIWIAETNRHAHLQRVTKML